MKPVQKIYRILIIILILIVAFLIVKYVDQDSGLFQDYFIFKYLGLVLGFLLTLTIVALNSIEKILAIIAKSQSIQKIKKVSTIDNINEIAKEIKHDTYFIFGCFVFVIILNIWSVLDIPKLHFLLKSDLIFYLKILTFLFSFWAIYDILQTVFSLYDISIMLHKRED